MIKFILFSLCVAAAYTLQQIPLEAAIKFGFNLEGNNVNLGISGGYIPKAHSFPYLAYLEVTKSNGSYSFVSQCGGSLISTKYILTAAHCVDTPGFDAHGIKIILGAHNLTAKENERQYFHAVEFTVHPSYLTDVSFDAAIVELNTKANITPGIVELVSVPKRSDIKNNYIGETGTIAGWGLVSSENQIKTNILHAASVVVEDCETPEQLICTRGTATTLATSACLGDAGGPLVVDGVAVGIISGGSQICETSNAQTYYARVAHYLHFIEDNTDVVIQP